jgi:hypothetical protein
VAGFLIGTPYALLDPGRFQQEFLRQYRYGETPWIGQHPEPVPLLYLASLLQGFGAIPLALALLGVGLAWRGRRSETVVCLVFPLAYLAFLLPKALFFPRFTIPLLPFLCMLAAYGTLTLVGRIPAAWRAASLLGLLTAAIAQSLTNDVLHNRLLMQADTRMLANEWAEANLPPYSTLVVEKYSLADLSNPPMTYTAGTRRFQIELLRGMSEEAQLRYLVERNPQYLVTSSFLHERCLVPPPRSPYGARSCDDLLSSSVLERAELLASFSPGHGGREVPFRIEDVMTPFWALGEYERPGPTVRLYSLAPLATGGP